MKHSPILLALFFPADETRLETSKSRLLGKYLELASWLKAELHLVLPSDERPVIEEELSRVHYPSTARPVTINLIQRDYMRETLESVERLSANYLCFEDGELGDARTPSAHLKQAILKSVQIPVFILPKRLPERALHFESFVVPISGEQNKSEALSESLKLAKMTDAQVALVHVAQPGEPCSCEAAGLDTVGDQAHHEYAHHLDKIVSEGSPTSSLKERKRVTHFAHLSGGAPDSISEFIKQTPNCILVLEWRGILIDGHAETLKALLRMTNAPIIVVKVSPQPRSKLKIGRDFEAA